MNNRLYSRTNEKGDSFTFDLIFDKETRSNISYNKGKLKLNYKPVDQQTGGGGKSMSSIDIEAFGMSAGNIDVNLLEVNEEYRTDDQHNEWEVHDAAKMVFLNKLGDWNSTTLQIIADVESKDARCSCNCSLPMD